MWVAGIDGCPAGWVVVFRSTTGLEPRGRIVDTFDKVLTAEEKPLRIAIDIPIGLPKVSLRGGRAADREARKLLGRERQSSVFPAPSRATLSATSFLQACDIERQNSTPPKKVSQQVFNILEKIRTIDSLVRRHSGIIFECHPEVTFCVMNGGVPMRLPKKVSRRKNPSGLNNSGLDERRELLVRNGFPRPFLTSRFGAAAACGWDDQLDACAAAWTAERILKQQCCRFPETPDLDETGWDMAIWA